MIFFLLLNVINIEPNFVFLKKMTKRRWKFDEEESNPERQNDKPSQIENSFLKNQKIIFRYTAFIIKH